MKIVLFLTVETPVNNHNVSMDSLNDTGTDLFCPEFDDKFISAFIDLNRKRFSDIVITYLDKDNKVFDIKSTYKNKEITLITVDRKEKVLTVFSNVTIPTGVGLLLPNGFDANLRTRSSTHNKGYSIETGLIDTSYTYGMGAQIKIDKDKDEIQVKAGEKFCQLQINKVNYFPITEVVSEAKWNNFKEVKKRRKFRDGGFGSTGDTNKKK